MATTVSPERIKATRLAGGKRIMVDRIEWVIMPDPASAIATRRPARIMPAA